MTPDVLDINQVTIEHVNPKSLHPHARNVKIYGDETVADLKERILASKWIKPLVATSNNLIISGHRRWRAATELGLLTVPVERRSFANETEELEALLLENESRDKTPEQKAREAQTWWEIEENKSRERMSLGAKILKQGVENFPHPDTGKTRDNVAERVGFGSGRNLEKAIGVVETADHLKEQGKVTESQVLLHVLNNQSVHAASKIAEEEEVRRGVLLETIAAGKTVKEAFALVEESIREPQNVQVPATLRYELSQKQVFDAIDAGIIPIDEEEEENCEEGYDLSTKQAFDLIDTGIIPIDEEEDEEEEDRAKEKRDAHVMRVMGSSDSPEWYTPQIIIDRVFQMFGEIDTDPCSNSHEVPTVPARTLYTKDDDGLAHAWTGKTYLNPPYGSEISAWTDKLVAEYKRGNVEEALALLPGRIDTVWFSPLYEYVMCNIRGRLQFANSPYNAPFPCVIVYLGTRISDFIEVFGTLGPIMRRIG